MQTHMPNSLIFYQFFIAGPLLVRLMVDAFTKK